MWIAIGCGAAAMALVPWALVSGQHANPEMFFTAGALLLIGGLAAASISLAVLVYAIRATLPRRRQAATDLAPVVARFGFSLEHRPPLLGREVAGRVLTTSLEMVSQYNQIAAAVTRQPLL